MTTLGPGPVGLAEVVAASRGTRFHLHPDLRARLDAQAAALQGPSSHVVAAVSGWLTGGDGAADVGAFLAAHDCAVGPRLTAEEARATLFARAVVLAKGCSGVRGHSVDAVLAALADPPTTRREGSLGAAGCPVLAGLFHALVRGGRVPAPTEKEALSWINGPSHAVALGALGLAQAQIVAEAAEAALALTCDAVRADLDAFHPTVLAARGVDGALAVAERLRRRVGPDLPHAGGPDAFSIRCAPIVHGAVADALDAAVARIERELNAVTDNPLWIDGRLLRGGNVHGAPTALALDGARVALTELIGISERRTYRLTHGGLSGLPSFLVRDSGLRSGLMLAQYTAASLVSEAKGLAAPSAVDNIPTAQHLEDHVSFAARSARATVDLADLAADVVAIELLCAAAAVDLRGGPSSNGTAAVHALVRSLVPASDRDGVLHDALRPLGEAVRAGAFR